MNKPILLIRILLLVFLLSFLKSNSQGFDLSWQISYEKFSLEKDKKMSFFKEYANHYNSIKFRAILYYKVPKPLFVYSTGLLYNRMCHENFTLNFLTMPVSINLQIGKKKGTFWGGGVKLRYLLNKPDDFYYKVGSKAKPTHSKKVANFANTQAETKICNTFALG